MNKQATLPNLVLAVLINLGLITSAKAALQLPSFFSDNMLLQQQELVNIWGTDKPNQMIKIETSWGASASTTANDSGKWQVKLQTSSAQTHQSINIQGSSDQRINNVALGEAWLCSGQSNMKISLLGNPNQPIFGSQEAILTSTNPNLRLFNGKMTESLTPQDNLQGVWQSAQPSSVANFGASCYFFGKKLQQILDVPVGLILSAKGASTAEAWTPKQTLVQLGMDNIPSEIPKKHSQQTPTVLFNGMIHPLIGYTIKGITWYQGEGNKPRAAEYKTLFSAMIGSWRSLWQQDLPFYFVHIAPFGKNNEEKTGAYLREAQLQTMLSVENTGMVSTQDIGHCSNIHPGEKQQVGNRLAYWALAKNYQVPYISYSGPIFKSMKVVEGKANLSFDYAENGLTSFNQEILGLEVAGEDKIFHPAQSKILKSTELQVWSELVAQPVAVRYAFQNCIEGRLFNTAGLPAPPFRTDSW